MRTIAISLLLVACNKQAPPEPAGLPPDEAGVAADAPAQAAHYPDTADARAFVDALGQLEITNLSPTGASEFVYRSMSFDAGGTWTADAELNVGGESAPCQESGTWRLDEVTDADTAVMVWTVTDTNCATRNEGDETRLLMDIEADGTYRVSFR